MQAKLKTYTFIYFTFGSLFYYGLLLFYLAYFYYYSDNSK